MLSGAKIKYINSLKQKKRRDAERIFIVEGEKNILDFIREGWRFSELFYTDKLASKLNNFASFKSINAYLVKASRLSGVGSLKTNDAGVAIVKQKELAAFYWEEDLFYLVLDGINNPGNLGTLIRLADWFGINQVLLSTGSVDCFNPKVVNASKGSLARVEIHYAQLKTLLAEYKGPVYGADSRGEDIHQLTNVKKGIILMGSESHGISTNLHPLVTKMVGIPGYGKAESLNVALAAAIITDHLISRG